MDNEWKFEQVKTLKERGVKESVASSVPSHRGSASEFYTAPSTP